MVAKNVFIAPVSNEQINKDVISSDAVKVAEKFLSIQGLIPIETIVHSLTEEERRRLEDIFPNKKVRIWGTRSTLRNIWESLDEGDYVVFYSANYYAFAAEAVYKTVNEKLARKVWGEYKTGETWNYVFFVKNVRELNMDRKEFNKKIGYPEKFVPRGFMRVAKEDAEEKIMNILTIKPATTPPRWWVEKTIVKGRPDRETGEYSLGKALWSPQQKRGGRRHL